MEGINMIKLVLFLLMLSGMIFAKDVIETKGSCSINWTLGDITCEGESESGQSRFAARTISKVVAQRNLLEVVKGVRVDSKTTVKDGMLGSDIIKSSVVGVIKGAEILSNVYSKEDKSALATIRLRMGKDILQALLRDKNKIAWNKKIMNIFSLFTTSLHAEDVVYFDEINKPLNDIDTSSNEICTGIIIDATEVKEFEKAILATLVDKGGSEFYPADIVSDNTLIHENGSVSYDFDDEDATKHRKVCHSPMKIKAQGIYEKRKSDLVLSHQDIEVLKKYRNSLLKKAKILVLLDDK